MEIKKMKKKISQIVAFSVLALLVIAIVLCAVIKLNYMPEMKLPEYPDVIQITDTEACGKYKALKGDEFNTFVTKFSDSFKLSVLYSLFSGKLGQSIASPKKVTDLNKGGYEVVFTFAEQVLKDNGKEVTVAKNSTETVKFNSLKFYVSENKGLSDDITLYFYMNNQTYYYSITAIANFDDLYDFINNMSPFAD